MEAVSWGCRLLTAHCILTWQKEGELYGAPCVKALIPFMRAHDLINSEMPHLLIPSLGALGFQHMNLERTQTFRPQQPTSLSNMNLNFFYSLCVLVAHFFLALNNIPLSGCTTVYLSIHSFSKTTFFYLAALDLSCIMWDLPLQHTDSLVVAHGLSSCGMWA